MLDREYLWSNPAAGIQSGNPGAAIAEEAKHPDDFSDDDQIEDDEDFHIVPSR